MQDIGNSTVLVVLLTFCFYSGCSVEIAPILTVIFTQSLNSGNVPEDWLTANVTPIFKKGIELTLPIIDLSL